MEGEVEDCGGPPLHNRRRSGAYFRTWPTSKTYKLETTCAKGVVEGDDGVLSCSLGSLWRPSDHLTSPVQDTTILNTSNKMDSMTLSEALESISISLSYSPTTKRLHAVEQHQQQQHLPHRQPPGRDESKQQKEMEQDKEGEKEEEKESQKGVDVKLASCTSVETDPSGGSEDNNAGGNTDLPRYVPGHRKAFSLPRTLEALNQDGNISPLPHPEVESPRSTLLRYGMVQQPIMFDRESGVSSISSLSSRTDFSQYEQQSEASSRCGDSGIQSQSSTLSSCPPSASAEKKKGSGVSLDFFTKGLTANLRLLSKSGQQVARLMRRAESPGSCSSTGSCHDTGNSSSTGSCHITGNISGLRLPGLGLLGESPSLTSLASSSVASSQSLIMEDRPPGLPAKHSEEKERHTQEFLSILESLKKREKEEAAERVRRTAEQRRTEDDLSAAATHWSTHILPHWASVGTTRKTLNLWWKGLPPPVRGKVWKLAFSNQLNLTPQLYSILVARAHDLILSKEASSGPANLVSEAGGVSVCREETLELIALDVARTFPQLCIFQKGGPYYDLLHNVLGAYVCYRPDLGYVQGMSFIAAILILNLDEADAFILFANLVNRPLLSAFFTLDQSLMEGYYCSFSSLLASHLPQISAHFTALGLRPELYLLEWIMTLFGRAAPLDLACRIWDIMFRDGQEFLFKAALGILSLYKEKLLKETDFILIAQFLSKLPDTTSPDLVLKEIEGLNLPAKHKTFPHVFAALGGTK